MILPSLTRDLDDHWAKLITSVATFGPIVTASKKLDIDQLGGFLSQGMSRLHRKKLGTQK